MYFRSLALLAGASLLAACSFSGQPPADYPSVVRAADAPAVTRGRTDTPAPTVAQDEETIAKEARIDAITRVALQKSPSILEARARTHAALARVKATGRLPDPELKWEIWGQPLHRPWALGETQMHMIGLRQSFPASGSLDAYTRVAYEEAKVALELQHARELDVVADVHKAWSSYFAADREKAIHLEHAELTRRLVDLSKVQLQVGKTGQGDVLRLSLELTRVHNDILLIDQQTATSRARLNVLMGRPLDAAIGPPPEPRAADVAPRVDALRAMVTKRPEMAAAGAAVKKSEAEVDAKKSEARVPTVMVGLDYQVMPMVAQPHHFGAMVQISLPWLNPRHGEEVKAAEAIVVAEKSAAAALEAMIMLQVHEALARYEAARASFVLIDTGLVPQAQKTFEAFQATWAAGGGDSLSVVDGLRTYLQVRVDRSRALAQLEIALADLERAIGGPLPKGKP